MLVGLANCTTSTDINQENKSLEESRTISDESIAAEENVIQSHDSVAKQSPLWQLILSERVHSSVVTDIHLSANGQFSAVVQDGRLYWSEIGVDEVLVSEKTVLSTAISPDGNIVAYFGAVETVDDLVTNDECDAPNAPQCGQLFILNPKTKEKNIISFGVKLGGLGNLKPSVAIASNGTIVVTAYGTLHKGTYIISENEEMKIISEDGISSTISSDGSTIVYSTADEMFVYDVFSGKKELIPLLSAGLLPFHEGANTEIDISSDGRFVLYVSDKKQSTNISISPCSMFSTELPNCRHVYLYDRDQETVELVTQSSQGEAANHISNNTTLSDSGQYIIFTSFASNLTSGSEACIEPFQNCPQLYIRDRDKKQTHLLSLSKNGKIPLNAWAGSISANGHFAAIHTTDWKTLLGLEESSQESSKPIRLNIEQYFLRQ